METGSIDELLLDHGHLGDIHLNPEIASRNQHELRRLQNVVNRRDRCGALDFRHELNVGIERRSQGPNVLSIPTETHRKKIDALVEGEPREVKITLANRGQRNVAVGKIDADPRPKRPSLEHLTRNSRRRPVNNEEANRPVIEKNSIADGNSMKRRGLIDPQRHFAIRKLDRRSGFDRRRERAREPKFRSGQVRHDAHGLSDRPLGRSNQANRLGVVSLRAVAHVDPKNVGARVEHRFNAGGRQTGRTDRRQNLCARARPHAPGSATGCSEIAA
jgi:hypothetical protein